jgi:hypothetical protein
MNTKTVKSRHMNAATENTKANKFVYLVKTFIERKKIGCFKFYVSFKVFAKHSHTIYIHASAILVYKVESHNLLNA